MTTSLDFRLPDLRFVTTDSVFPHERFDSQRTDPLVKRLRESGSLRNPPIVAQVGDGQRVETRYVVLDGANRSTAARAAGWPHICVQVVRYESPTVELHTWYHALAGDDPAAVHARLDRELDGVPGLRRAAMDGIHARATLARREALACVSYADGEVFALQGGRTLHERNVLLNAIVDTYQDRIPYSRVTTDSLARARREHPEACALVIFPRFDPAEVIELASQDEHLPAGITRHLIQWRALRVDVPVAMCMDTLMSLPQKNAWLQEWLDDRLRQRRVRFYEEPTVLFDE
jgi:hypothetical protein